LIRTTKKIIPISNNYKLKPPSLLWSHCCPNTSPRHLLDFWESPGSLSDINFVCKKRRTARSLLHTSDHQELESTFGIWTSDEPYRRPGSRNFSHSLHLDEPEIVRRLIPLDSKEFTSE
jgi:hypothetical protein